MTDRSYNYWEPRMDIRDLDRRAIESTGAIIDKLSDDQLDLPTPCAKWTVRELIEHMVGNNHRMVARATGEEREPTGDARRDYRTSAAALVSTFADDAAMATTFDVPLAGGEIDARAMLTVHFTDVLVHGWDLARSIGADIALDPELAQAAVAAVSRFPDGSGVWSEEGSVFGPRIAVPEDADPQDRLLGLTGRNRGWTAA